MKKCLLLFLYVCIITISWSDVDKTSEEDVATCTLDTNGECLGNDDNINNKNKKKERKFTRKTSESDKMQELMEESDKLNAMSTHERIAHVKRLGEKEKKEKEAQGIAINTREMKVVFQNKSGKKTKLWWKGPNENVLQGDLDSPGETIIHTFMGHEFFYSPFEEPETVLYSSIMERHVELIQLLNEKEMKKRGEEFERERRDFMKKYFEETGRTWQNYYPREPVSSFMYDITEVGQRFEQISNHSKYRTCPSHFMNDEIFIGILNDLESEESEYKIEFLASEKERLESEEETKLGNEDTMKKENEVDEKSGLKRSVGEDRDWFHKIPVYSAFWSNYSDIESGDIYKVFRYNDSVLCQNLNELQTIELSVVCTKPRLVNMINFLSDEECTHIIEVGSYLGLKRSTVSEAALQSLDRTSQTVWIERKFSPIVDNVIKRIGDSLHVDHNKLFLNVSAESLQLVHYYPGELYKPHWDYGTDSPNNRWITFLMYLWDVKEGGNTSFPNAIEECTDDSDYLGVRPVKGSAAWFYDLFPDGNVDDSTLHYAEPPGNDSEKWMTNLWIWDPYFK